ncbi:MAG: universal stress protein [Pseudohongiellaceae bacterium]
MSIDIQTPLITEVLACIDGSRYSEAVCDYAAWFSLNLSAPLALLHNLEHSENAASSDLSGAIGLGSRETLLEELTTLEGQRNRLLLEQGKSMLQAAKERVVAAGIAAPTLKQRHDGLTESLIAMEQDIRLLVLGVRGEEHAQDDLHLGSHLEASIRALHKPILVVNCDFKTPKKIMLAFDGSDASSKALELLVNSKRFTELPVHLVTVGESSDSSLALQTEATQKLKDAGHEVTAVVLEGDPCETLHSYQDEHQIDLTLMGAFSHTRLREWVLGSMTVKMLLSSSRPLLLLR